MAATKYKDVNGVWRTIPTWDAANTHFHGNISNDGKIGADSNKILVTSNNGDIVAIGIEELYELLDNIIKQNKYDIGDVYISIDPTSPATLFGGTWAAIEAGRFLVAAGSGYEAGSVGGQNWHNHGLTGGFAQLLINQYPGPVTRFHYSTKGVTGYITSYKEVSGGLSSYTATVGGAYVALGGSADASNHIPPWFGVYMWYRVE